MNAIVADYVDINHVVDKKYGDLFILSFAPGQSADTVLNLAFPLKEFCLLLTDITKKARMNGDEPEWIWEDD